MSSTELAVLPLLRCECGWLFRRRCPNPLHLPPPRRLDPRRLTLEVVRQPDGEGGGEVSVLAYCPARVDVAGNMIPARKTHCWHGLNITYTTNPPGYPEKCCYCGAERTIWGDRPVGPPNGHGPFA